MSNDVQYSTELWDQSGEEPVLLRTYYGTAEEIKCLQETDPRLEFGPLKYFCWGPVERVPDEGPPKHSERGTSNYATRHNEGKPDMSLLPAEALYQMAYVAMDGVKEYGRDNWRALWGEDTVNVCNASLMRHAAAMNEGILYDKKSGLPHAAHIMMNCAFILEYLKQKKEK